MVGGKDEGRHCRLIDASAIKFGGFFKLAFESAWQKKFFGCPAGNGSTEGLDATWGGGEECIDDALELAQRFLVVGDVVELLWWADSKKVLQGMAGESGIVFDARKAFLLQGAADLAILN